MQQRYNTCGLIFVTCCKIATKLILKQAGSKLTSKSFGVGRFESFGPAMQNNCIGI